MAASTQRAQLAALAKIGERLNRATQLEQDLEALVKDIVDGGAYSALGTGIVPRLLAILDPTRAAAPVAPDAVRSYYDAPAGAGAAVEADRG